MSDFAKCTKCGEYDFSSTHKCPLKWKVFHIEYMGDEEFSVIYAGDAQDAAKKYAEKYDADDDTLMQGEEIEVQVVPFDGGETKIFIVTGEAEPVYYATEKKNV
jgi:hypothetical protein